MNDSALHAALRRFEADTGLALTQVDRLASSLRITPLRDREPAFSMGDVCPRIYIVREGCLKQQYIDEDGNEWIKSFAGPGDMFACPFALQPCGRCSFASVSIGASVVESIDYRVIEELAADDIGWQTALRIAFQRLAELKVQREKDLLMLSAEDMYRKFVREQPLLLERITQKDLAAYLGVTAVGLNRIIRRQALS